MFMECQHGRLDPCADCAGTGIRGGKKSGKKKCHTCGSTLHPGQVYTCTSIEPPCMHCPRQFQADIHRVESTTVHFFSEQQLRALWAYWRRPPRSEAEPFSIEKSKELAKELMAGDGFEIHEAIKEGLMILLEEIDNQDGGTDEGHETQDG